MPHLFFTLRLVAALALIFLGIYASRRLARLPAPYWSLGYALPLLLILAIALGRHVEACAFVPPFSALARPRINIYFLAPAIPILFLTLLPRLRTLGQRRAIVLFAACITIYYCFLPILLPWAPRPTLAALPTRFDRIGVCLQAHEFTCGPAAAVSALRRLHIPAEESALALEAQAAPVLGTDAVDLTAAIQSLYHVPAAYRPFATLDDLAPHLPAVTSIRLSLLVHHYVAILDITPTQVLLADPLLGRQVLPRAAFLPLWSHAAITLNPD